MNIAELFARIGLKVDQAPADNFLKSMNGIKSSVSGAIAGTLSLTMAIKTVNSAFADTLGMKKFEADTGASVEEMQRWKAVADQVSGAGDTVAASIRAITDNQEKIKLGQGNISGYQLLGIDPRSDPIKVLEALRDKTQNMSAAMRRNIASQFGVSKDLVSTLELTNDQFDRMASSAFVVDKGSIDIIDKARSSVTQLGQIVNYFKTQLVAEFAPSIIKVTKSLTEWVKANKEGLINGLKLVTEWAGRFWTMITRIWTILNTLITSTMGWKNALLGIVGLFIAMNAAVALPVAGIILLFAVLEDLYVYSKGGKSLFGELVKVFPELGKAFDVAFEGLQGIMATLKGIFTGDWSTFDTIVSKWGTFGEILIGIKDSLVFIMDALKGDVEIGSGLDEEGRVKTDALSMAKHMAQVVIGGMKNAPTMGFSAAIANQAALNQSAFIDPNRLSNQNVTNNNTVTNAPVIHIDGAQNPQAVAEEVQKRTARSYEDAMQMWRSTKAEVK